MKQTQNQGQHRHSKISHLVLYLLLFLVSISGAFAFQWFEDFEDQPISNNVSIFDNGTTAWTSNVTGVSIIYHGVASKLGTQAFYFNDVTAEFETQQFNASDSTTDSVISYIVAVIEDQDNYGAGDEIKAYIIPNNGIPILHSTLLLNTIDKNNEGFGEGHVVTFTTDYDVYAVQFIVESDNNNKHVIIDNILVEWVNANETAFDNLINVTSNFNSTFISNSNETIIVNNVFNASIENNFNITFGEIPSNATIKFALGEVCPFYENVSQSQRYIYIILAIITSITLFSTFAFNSPLMELITIFSAIYLALASMPCDVFLTLVWVCVFLAGFITMFMKLVLGIYIKQLMSFFGKGGMNNNR